MSAETELQQQAAGLGIRLDAGACRQLLRMLQELERWNRHFNLTAVRCPEEALERHLLDSLTLEPLLPMGCRVLDLGSGAGFPGLALALVRPDLRLVSVDSIGKKIRFQRHLLRTLPFADVTAVQARAEDLAAEPDYAGGFDRVVSRAFSSLPLFARLGAPFLAPEGQLLAMKGPEGERELAQALPELTALGLAGEVAAAPVLPRSAARRSLIRLMRQA